MAGRRILAPSIKVRILVPQPGFLELAFWSEVSLSFTVYSPQDFESDKKKRACLDPEQAAFARMSDCLRSLLMDRDACPTEDNPLLVPQMSGLSLSQMKEALEAVGWETGWAGS